MADVIAKVVNAAIFVFALILIIIVIATWDTITAIGDVVMYLIFTMLALIGLAWTSRYSYHQICEIIVTSVQTKLQRTQIEEEIKQVQDQTKRKEDETKLLRRKEEAEARKLEADATKAETESKVLTVVAKEDEQVYITSTDEMMQFIAAHLAMSGQLNGKPIEPNPLQISAWQHWNTARTPHKLPALTQGSSDQHFMASIPEQIDLLSLLPATGPSINNVIIGVTINANGQLETVTSSLEKLVHVGVAGSSGWGKSVWLQSLAFQLAMAPDPIQLALIDLEASTFSPFVPLGNDRLGYPVVDEDQDILAVLADLVQELKRRKEAYKPFPVVQNLEQYNQVVEPHLQLPYLVVMIDEATTLLDDKDVRSLLTPLALRGRKFGIFLILGGQDWSVDSVPSKIKNQFSTKIHFKANTKSQSRVLLGKSDAEEIAFLGRALCVMRGKSLFEMQSPMIDMQTILDAVDSLENATRPEMPDTSTETTIDNGREEQILQLIADGLTNDEIARRFGYKRAAGTIFYEIKATRGKLAAATATSATITPQ